MLKITKITKTTALIIICISTNMFSQMQNEFYVDDAEKIDIVTLNFCVDKDGKTMQVKVVPEKTTYKNLENIGRITDYLKGAEYNPESSLSNNCQDLSFSFINQKYQDKHLDASKFALCEKLKIGIFHYDNILFADTEIERTNDIQIEKTSKDIFKYKIEWPEPNKYILTYLEVSDSQYNYLLGEKISVEIIDVMENGEYVYKSEFLNRTFITGIMRKIK
ncbi:hypothetical protein [Flavobacterium sp. XGLA_31]|uniref:hypothetical protein n=1 Tax=Flavobacterium sp. XGLA_31 TaxID=3447666 RepID=UPI003F3FE1F1